MTLTLADLGTGTPKGHTYWRNANTCQKRIWLEEQHGRPEILKPSASVGTVLHALLGKYHGGSLSPFSEHDDASILDTLKALDDPKWYTKAERTFERYKAVVEPEEWGEVQAVERAIPLPNTPEENILQDAGWHGATGSMDLVTRVDERHTENLATKWNLYLPHGIHQWDFKTWESALFRKSVHETYQPAFYKELYEHATGTAIRGSHLVLVCRWEKEGKVPSAQFPVDVVGPTDTDPEVVRGLVIRGHELLKAYPGQANAFACDKGFGGWPCDYKDLCDRRDADEPK